FTDEQKQTVLTTYAACRNNATQTARFCKDHYGFSVSADQVSRWARGDFIAPSVRKSADEKKARLVTLFEEEIRAAFHCAANKRAEASYKDLMTGIGILTDKVQLLQGQPTSITQQNLTDDERAKRIEEILAEARKRREGLAGK